MAGGTPHERTIGPLQLQIARAAAQARRGEERALWHLSVIGERPVLPAGALPMAATNTHAKQHAAGASDDVFNSGALNSTHRRRLLAADASKQPLLSHAGDMREIESRIFIRRRRIQW